MKSESALTRALMVQLSTAMSGSIVIKHSDRFTVGVPDISVNWNGTAWLEIKATEGDRLEHHKNWGAQLLLCRRLERATHRCWFVIYRERNGTPETEIVTPHEVFDDRRVGLPAWSSSGYSHAGAARWLMERLHDSKS